jgi:hypothetical protein
MAMSRTFALDNSPSKLRSFAVSVPAGFPSPATDYIEESN